MAKKLCSLRSVYPTRIKQRTWAYVNCSFSTNVQSAKETAKLRKIITFVDQSCALNMFLWYYSVFPLPPSLSLARNEKPNRDIITRACFDRRYCICNLFAHGYESNVWNNTRLPSNCLLTRAVRTYKLQSRIYRQIATNGNWLLTLWNLRCCPQEKQKRLSGVFKAGIHNVVAIHWRPKKVQLSTAQ